MSKNAVKNLDNKKKMLWILLSQLYGIVYYNVDFTETALEFWRIISKSVGREFC